jgi:hypothetical protein
MMWIALVVWTATAAGLAVASWRSLRDGDRATA